MVQVDARSEKTRNISNTAEFCMPGQTNSTGYKKHFCVFSALSASPGNFWYSFHNSMVQCLQLDTETDLGYGFIAPDEPRGAKGEPVSPVKATINVQAALLEPALAAVNSTKTPKVVVAGHYLCYLSHATAVESSPELVRTSSRSS